MNKWGCGIAFKTSPQEHERFCGLYGQIGKPERWPTRKQAQAEVDRIAHYWRGHGRQVSYWVVDLEKAGYE